MTPYELSPSELKMMKIITRVSEDDLVAFFDKHESLEYYLLLIEALLDQTKTDNRKVVQSAKAGVEAMRANGGDFVSLVPIFFESDLEILVKLKNAFYRIVDQAAQARGFQDAETQSERLASCEQAIHQLLSEQSSWFKRTFQSKRVPGFIELLNRPEYLPFKKHLVAALNQQGAEIPGYDRGDKALAKVLNDLPNAVLPTLVDGLGELSLEDLNVLEAEVVKLSAAD